MSSHAPRLALVGALMVGCTVPPPAALELDDEPAMPPRIELPSRLPQASADYGEYVEIPGGELDGRQIPPLYFKRTEVTVAEYRACYQHGECSKPDRGGGCNWGMSDRDQHPVNCVSWSQAEEYCTWAGGRLPTEWEWEWAARGREAARPYPWGHAQATCARAVMAAGEAGCGTGTLPVASKPKGASVDGLHDMAGNVWEWTATVEHSGCGSSALLKGGSTGVANPRWLRVDYELPSPSESQSTGDGIRCVRDLPRHQNR